MPALTKQQAKEAEPPTDFNDDGGGCEHPECATEHIIMAAIMQIMEALNVFVYAEWDFSDFMRGELAQFGDGLIKAFGPDADASEIAHGIGEIYVPTKRDDDHDN